ncbi:unnamed protein product, partial [Tenebrio molitor]
MRGKTYHKACGNCNKKIPPHNYVLHTAHCARNITLCHLCTEPIPRNQFESHLKACVVAKQKKKPPPPSPIKLELSSYYREQKAIEDKKAVARKERLIRKYDRMLDPGYKLGSGKRREKCLVCGNFKDQLSHFLCLLKDFDSAVTTASAPTYHDTATKLTAAAAFSLLPTITKTTTETTHSTAAGASLFIRAEQLPRQPPTAVTTASAPTYHDTATKLTAAAAFSLLPTITKTTTETTHSTAAGASLFIPRGTAGGSHHQPADDKNASGDAPVYYGATPREVFRVGAEQLPRQPPTAVTTASAPTYHDTATKLTAAAAFSLLPTITKQQQKPPTPCRRRSLFIPRGTAGGSHHQPADDKNASGDAPVYYEATPRERFRVDAGLPRQPPTAATAAPAPAHHDTALSATKPTATAASSVARKIKRATRRSKQSGGLLDKIRDTHHDTATKPTAAA